MTGTAPSSVHDARAAFDSVCSEAKTFADLSEVQLNWQPVPGSWSVGQCLEHLTVTARRYRDVMAPAITSPRSSSRASALKLSWSGKLFVRLLLAPARRFRVPRKFAPPATVGTGVVAEFEQSHHELAELLQQATGLPLSKIKVGSPVSALVRFNLADCFTILAVHARRHIRQANRVRESPGFPVDAPN